MASYVYNKFKEELLNGGSSWNHATPYVYKAQLCAGTQPLKTVADPVAANIANPAVTSGGVIDPTIGSVLLTNGIFRGANVTMTSITGGGSAGDFTNVMIYNSTNNRLMALIDLPNVVPATGGDIELQWDTSSTMNDVAGVGGIFAL